MWLGNFYFIFIFLIQELYFFLQIKNKSINFGNPISYFLLKAYFSSFLIFNFHFIFFGHESHEYLSKKETIKNVYHILWPLHPVALCMTIFTTN